MTRAFFEAQELDEALKTAGTLLDERDLKALKSIVTTLGTGYRRIWKDGKIPLQFVEKTKYSKQRDELAEFLAGVARFYDVDGDGDPDLYVCNDFDDPDHFWINRGDGTFGAAPPFALRTNSHASMSVDFADIDRDGHVDFFVAEMLPRSPRRKLVQVPLHVLG